MKALKLIVCLSLISLTGCTKVINKAQEIVNDLKYQYYYRYQGEVLCVVDEVIRNGEKVDTPADGLNIHITELQSDQPKVEYMQKNLAWRKVIESVPMVNLQYLDIVTGSSTVLILDKNSGKVQVVENLYGESGELSFVVQKAHCK